MAFRVTGIRKNCKLINGNKETRSFVFFLPGKSNQAGPVQDVAVHVFQAMVRQAAWDAEAEDAKAAHALILC